MNDATKKQTTKPIMTVREGAVAASIWKRQSPTGFQYYDFSLSRSWKTKASGKEGYSPNFFLGNEEQLSIVVKKASLWIASQKPECTEHRNDKELL